MAYETGTATSVVDLLNKFATFIEANGWTRDSLGDEGSGRRYHAHNGSVYVNMRAYANEDPPSTILGHGSTGTYSWAFNIGTGYDGGTAWHQQAGAPLFTGSTYYTAGMNKIDSSVPAYHFFAHNGGDQIIAVVEHASGSYQYLGFGSLVKYGTWTGGEYMYGSMNGVTNNEWSTGSGIVGIGFFQAPANGSSFNRNFPNVALIDVDVDAETGWHVTDPVSQATTRRKVLDLQYLTAINSDWLYPSTLNALHPFHPVVAAVFRDTSNDTTTSPISMLGELPGVHYCNIDNFVPAQQVTLGATDYRVFPWGRKKTTAGKVGTVSGPSGHTAFFGFAVEE